MDYPKAITPILCQIAIDCGLMSDTCHLLEITAFGDAFIQENDTIKWYSFTDGTISDVTALIDEFGLPPVSLDLGDEWYQLSTQAELKAHDYALAETTCFSFKKPLYKKGEYSMENIQVVALEELWKQRIGDLTIADDDNVNT